MRESLLVRRDIFPAVHAFCIFGICSEWTASCEVEVCVDSWEEFLVDGDIFPGSALPSNILVIFLDDAVAELMVLGVGSSEESISEIPVAAGDEIDDGSSKQDEYEEPIVVAGFDIQKCGLSDYGTGDERKPYQPQDQL